MTKLALATILFCTLGHAQIIGGGVSYNQSGSPSIAGTGIYAKELTSGLWSFSLLDVIPTSTAPVTLTTQLSTGIGQRLFTVKSWQIFAPTTTGITWTGSNTGWTWTSGLMGIREIKGRLVMPNVRWIKSTTNNNSSYQCVAGVMIGWKL